MSELVYFSIILAQNQNEFKFLKLKYYLQSFWQAHGQSNNSVVAHQNQRQLKLFLI